MRKFLATFILMASALFAVACPVCEKNQPKVLQGITHGTGPQGPGDYVIIWIAIIVVLITLFYSVKWLIKPGEKSTSHIKYFIINAD